MSLEHRRKVGERHVQAVGNIGHRGYFGQILVNVGQGVFNQQGQLSDVAGLFVFCGDFTIDGLFYYKVPKATLLRCGRCAILKKTEAKFIAKRFEV